MTIPRYTPSPFDPLTRSAQQQPCCAAVLAWATLVDRYLQKIATTVVGRCRLSLSKSTLKPPGTKRWKLNSLKLLSSFAEAVQVYTIEPLLKAPGTERLKLKCEKLLSTVAFNLRRYTVKPEKMILLTTGAAAGLPKELLLPLFRPRCGFAG